VADPVPGKTTGKAKSPAPIIVLRGPNGLTISSDDIAALDEFERLLTEAADESGNGPMAVYYLKNAKALAAAQELETVLAGGTADSAGPSEKTSASRKALATGPFKITPDTRLNALFVLANRADRETISRLLKVIDLDESPENTAVAPKPRIIPVRYAKATEVADDLRQVYADRLVVGQNQGRGAVMAMVMRGMMAGGRGGGRGGGRAPRQNQPDPATRIAIGVDVHTNSLVIDAADPLFQEAKELVQEIDAANAEQNETVEVVPLHRTDGTAIERALVAFGGDAVQANNFNPNYRNNNTAFPGASQGYARSNNGQRSMGNNRPFGGNFSPYQGFGGQRGSRFSQSGRPGP